MPRFTYQAKQGPANVIEGTMQAASQDEVVAQLMRRGLVPVTILITPNDLTDGPQRGGRVRVTRKERRMFTRQLTSLLRAKTELVPAITILKDQSPSKSARLLLEDLEGHMREGNRFSEAVARHPGVFSSLFLSAIRAGEMAGKLDDILIKLVEFDDQQDQLESRLRGALAYPILLLVLGLACLVFFIWFIVPKMAGLYTNLGGTLPWPTKMLIQLSAGLVHSWGWVLAAIIGMILLIRWARRLPVVISATERFLKCIPFSRDILEARQIGRFTRTLQLLLQSGLPVFQAMDVARPTMASRLMEARMEEAQESVKRGESIAHSLKIARCFPPLVTHMVAVGESAGTLVDVLDELASYYERSLDETLRIATSLIEPLMIVVMGILVGFCVLAMVLPIFQMTRLVQ